MKQKIVRLSAVIGVVLFGFIVYKIGPAQIWGNIKKLTVLNFTILMLLRLLYWILRTINWKVILEQYEKKVSLWELFVARMTSHTVSQLFPSAQVGGEAARIFMVHTSNKRISIASVIVDKTIEFLSVLIFTIFAVGFIFLKVNMSPGLRTLFIVFEVSFLLLVAFMLIKQKHGLITWVVDLFARIRIRPKFLEKHRDKIKETDDHIADFYLNHRKTFVQVLFLYSLLIMLWVAEVYLTIVYLGGKDVSFMDSFLITVLGNLAFMFPFVPGMLGVYEATYILVFAMLGKKTGVAFSLVLMRRIIALLWAGIGLLGMMKSIPGKRTKSI
ncbi:MAG: lysylphosphatidylglycerol synthase transmembrane domain-containing protein [Candidatus Omnitrophota bacterium]